MTQLKNLRKPQKNAFFAIFAHEMGSKSLKNNVFGLAASNDPYFDPSHTSLALQGEKWWPGTFLGFFFGYPLRHLIFFNFDNIYMFLMAKNGNFQFSGPLTKKLGGDGGVTSHSLHSVTLLHPLCIWQVLYAPFMYDFK